MLERFTMSKKELSTHGVIQRYLSWDILQKEAARQLQKSTRQIRRIAERFLKEWASWLIHKARWRPSNNIWNPQKYIQALNIIQEHYSDYGITLCKERLEEKHNISIPLETLRWKMIEAGLWKEKKQKKQAEHRHARPRKDSYWEMVQYDGSYHAWFEWRNNTTKQCLLVAIDDASGKVSACFDENEWVDATFRFWKKYCESHGKPMSIYLDKFASYKTNVPESRDTQEVPTQFGRVCQELGIHLIFAQSPQAKGRVERINRTLQDRLIKALREENIADIQEANIFLENIFLPDFNRRFMVQTVSSSDLHIPLRWDERERLAHIFSRHIPRKIANDFTIRFENKYYQLYRDQEKKYMIRKEDTVTVEKHLDDSIYISKNNILIHYVLSFEKPQKLKYLTAPILPDSLKADILTQGK